MPLLLLLLDNQAIVFAIDTDVVDLLLAVSGSIPILTDQNGICPAADLDFSDSLVCVPAG